MRGVATFIVGLFVISAVVLFAGALLDPLAETIASFGAVESLGWDDSALDIRDTILRWVPLLYIGYTLIWGLMWYLRRERLTAVR